MSFQSVRTETSARYFELQQFHRLLVANEIDLRSPPEHPTLKGHFIVGLYAYIEFVVQNIVKASILHINSSSIQHKHLQPDIFTLLADPSFTSASVVSGEKKWLKRHEIISSMSKSDICTIHDSVLFKEIQNTRVSTIEMLFKIFSLDSNPLVNSRAGGYINEIGERRNAVAHGRESAAEVGGRFTTGALGDRLLSLEVQAFHMLTCFEDAALRKRFIKPRFRRHYPV